jgi:hypothetical protein
MIKGAHFLSENKEELSITSLMKKREDETKKGPLKWLNLKQVQKRGMGILIFLSWRAAAG